MSALHVLLSKAAKMSVWVSSCLHLFSCNNQMQKTYHNTCNTGALKAVFSHSFVKGSLKFVWQKTQSKHFGSFIHFSVFRFSAAGFIIAYQEKQNNRFKKKKKNQKPKKKKKHKIIFEKPLSCHKNKECFQTHTLQHVSAARNRKKDSSQ